MQCTFSSFTGEIFKKRPFFTCWSRRNENQTLKSLKIAKLSKEPNIPWVFDINLEFHGYDSPVECEKKSEGSLNPKYSEIWTESVSGLVL